MHKSKGLEYPLVYIPFPWSFFKPIGKKGPPFFHAADDHAACIDLGSADLDAHRRREQVEQIAERVRLLYVAVTRAARLCVLCWGKVNGIEDSAPAWLLHPLDAPERIGSRMKGLDEDEIRADLEHLAARRPDSILVRDLPAPDGTWWQAAQPDQEGLAAAQFDGHIDDRWRVGSYSALVRGGDDEQPDYDPAAADGAVRPAVDDGASAAEAPQLDLSIAPDAVDDALFELPAGTRVGQFLHEIFELIDFPSADAETLATVVDAQLARYGGLSTGDDQGRDWSATVVDLVTGVLDTSLDPDNGLRLRDIPLADRLTELEFHFPVADLDPAGLRAALNASPEYAAGVRGLGFAPMRGLMRGFIDLVFRYQGRFYIVDYKSNRLGHELAAYDRDGMGRAIREHRYDLQYLIYSLALHRFLGRRLADYDYQRDFGGVYYLFLRGMRPPRGPVYGVWHARPPAATITCLDELFRGHSEEEA